LELSEPDLALVVELEELSELFELLESLDLLELFESLEVDSLFLLSEELLELEEPPPVLPAFL
jgi:hypothetical protein